MDPKMKNFISLILAFIVTISFAKGQQTFQSLDDIWSFALLHSQENAVYKMQIEKAKNDKNVANSYRYPKVYFGAAGQYNAAIPETPIPGEVFGRPGETIFAQLGQTFNYTSGVNTSKTILDWQSKFQAKISQSNISLVQAEKDLFEQNLKQQLAQVYYALLTAHAAVDLSLKDLSLADSTLLLTANRNQEGLIDKVTLNQAIINRNNALDRVEQNKRYLFENETNLKSLLGLSLSDTFLLKEKIRFDDDIFLEGVSPDDRSLTLHKLQIDKAAFATKQAYYRYLPKIDVVAYLGTIQYQEEFGVSFKSNAWQPSRYIGLNLSVPLFTGFSTKNQYRSAKISENIAQKNFDDAKRKSSLNDNILFKNYTTASYSVQAADRNLKLADENVQLIYSKYAAGLVTLDNYLSAHDDYLAAENQYFSRLSEYLMNKAIIQSRNK